jgi:hypothetical protein
MFESLNRPTVWIIISTWETTNQSPNFAGVSHSLSKPPQRIAGSCFEIVPIIGICQMLQEYPDRYFCVLSNICIEPRARKVGHIVQAFAMIYSFKKMAAQQSSNLFETKTYGWYRKRRKANGRIRLTQ